MPNTCSKFDIISEGTQERRNKETACACEGKLKHPLANFLEAAQDMTLNATQSQQATAPQSGGHTFGSGMQASVPFGFLAMVLTCTVTDSGVCCEEPALAAKTLRHKNTGAMNAICMRTSHEVRRKTHTCVRCSFMCSASYQSRLVLLC